MSDRNFRLILRFFIAISLGVCITVAVGPTIGISATLCAFFIVTYIDTLCAEISRERSLRLLSIEQAIRQLEGK